MNQQELNNFFDSEIKKGSDAFKTSFLEKKNLDDFSMREEKWIKNNLTFIYAKEPGNVLLKINPYHQIVKYIVENNGAEETREYILLPKYLALQKLQIHAGQLEKADLLIKVFINYADSFTLNEITEKILQNSNLNKKEELNARLQLMIRKFLSYQYLIIE